MGAPDAAPSFGLQRREQLNDPEHAAGGLTADDDARHRAGAIINICTNALDAMPCGGVLRLFAMTEQIAEGGKYAAGLAPGDYVRLEVAGTGMGMDEATLTRVSEPFFTTKPQGQGTGLGVAMVKGFAQQSGDALSIDSAPAAGTTVKI